MLFLEVCANNYLLWLYYNPNSLAGSGYVGSNVVQAALRSGHEVVSINRNAPAFSDNPHLTYRAGDVLKADDWRDELTGCDAVISCVGCFGSNEVCTGIYVQCYSCNVVL